MFLFEIHEAHDGSYSMQRFAIALKYWTRFFHPRRPLNRVPVKQSRSDDNNEWFVFAHCTFDSIIRSIWFVRLVFFSSFAMAWEKTGTTTTTREKLWRLFEWSRSLNAAAAHHAHCKSSAYSLCCIKPTPSTGIKSGGESSITRYGCVWCACRERENESRWFL